MQSPFASRATPAICTFRLARSMKKSTRNLVKPLRVQASMVKKSAATIISRCRDRNSPPGGLPLTLRRRFQALLPQNVGDRAPSDFVAQIGQRSLNSPVAPIAVLRGHADYQPLNLVWGAWSAEASPLEDDVDDDSDILPDCHGSLVDLLFDVSPGDRLRKYPEYLAI